MGGGLVDLDYGRCPPTTSLSGLVTAFTDRVRQALIIGENQPDPVWTLLRTHRRLHPRSDLKLIRYAYAVAEQMHRGQMRKSGDPYITHPLEVAQVLADLGMDTTTLVAALLHDTVEDTTYTMPQLRTDFGNEVALLVDGVTKFDKHHYGKNAEVETIRKMLVAADQDVRVLIIKLADRLHNMRTLDARSPASRARIARATQDVLIPLCERLGIQALKREIEDSVLAALEPDAYHRLKVWVSDRPTWISYRDDFIKLAQAALKTERIRATVCARPRHLFTIWRDNQATGHQLEHELPRVVVVVGGAETECYTALGAIHQHWRPVPGRFKDFIASPKNNLYRSLHTTVIGPVAQQVEVLIRTETMHRNAEFGVVAPFRFRRGQGAHTERGRAARREPDNSDHLAWLRRVVRWQREAVDPARFLESLRCDLAEKQILVFAHSRQLLLPDGATPVDVAYALDNERGRRCVAATVNGQLAFLSSPLADGDVIEVHSVDDGEASGDGGPIGPSEEWLDFVRTPHAQLQIRQWLAQRQEPDPDAAPPVPIATKVRIGRSALSLELLRRERRLTVELPLLALTEELGLPDVDTLFVALADHKITATEVAEQLIHFVDSGRMHEATVLPKPRSPLAGR